MNLFKKISLAIVLVLGLSFLAGICSGATIAAPVDEVTQGVNLGGGSGDPEGDVNNLLKTILNIMSWVAGIITIIMVIIGGIKFSTSGGDPEKTKSAKGTLTFALVGMVIVILAQVIVRFVLKQVSG